MRPISEADKWQEGWDKMEETDCRERDIGEPDEDDLFEYKRQDREEKGIAHHEERRRREPPIGDPCERCNGMAWVFQEGPAAQKPVEKVVCPRCHGTKVEP